jgi:hypothetical protein
VTHDMENLKEWNTNTKHNGRPLQQTRQAEDRISELEDRT